MSACHYFKFHCLTHKSVCHSFKFRSLTHKNWLKVVFKILNVDYSKRKILNAWHNRSQVDILLNWNPFSGVLSRYYVYRWHWQKVRDNENRYLHYCPFMRATTWWWRVRECSTIYFTLILQSHTLMISYHSHIYIFTRALRKLPKLHSKKSVRFPLRERYTYKWYCLHHINVTHIRFEFSITNFVLLA